MGHVIGLRKLVVLTFNIYKKKSIEATNSFLFLCPVFSPKANMNFVFQPHSHMVVQ